MLTLNVCARCSGKGIFQFRRTHLGVPGLCFRCDGTGKEPAQESAPTVQIPLAKARISEADAYAAFGASL